MTRARLLALVLILIVARAVVAAPFHSGLDPGATVLPFSSNVVTGPYRGMQHCFVCDTRADEVGLVFFVHGPDTAAARVAQAFFVEVQRTARVLCWMVVLGPKGSAAEDALGHQVEAFAQQTGLAMNATVLGDPDGPAGYNIASDAKLTVILFRHQQVLMNAAWPASTWSDQAAEEATRSLSLGLKKLQVKE